MTQEEARYLLPGDRAVDTEIGWHGEFKDFHDPSHANIVWDGYKSIWFLDIRLLARETAPEVFQKPG